MFLVVFGGFWYSTISLLLITVVECTDFDFWESLGVCLVDWDTGFRSHNVAKTVSHIWTNQGSVVTEGREGLVVLGF